jgi:hypothetical protein
MKHSGLMRLRSSVFGDKSTDGMVLGMQSGGAIGGLDAALVPEMSVRNVDR